MGYFLKLIRKAVSLLLVSLVHGSTERGNCRPMDKIVIEDMVVHGIVGAKARERTKPQSVRVTLELFLDLSLPSKTDELQDTIDYRFISHL